MSVQQHSCWVVGDGFPEDFGERLEAFMQASGLGPRPLGRLLGVSPYRVREWRRGAVPSSHYLSRLLTVAEDMGLSAVLMRPEGDVFGRDPERGDGAPSDKRSDSPGGGADTRLLDPDLPRPE